MEVTTTEDVLHMMRIGARNRHMAATNMNDRSSRSHQVLTIVVDGENRLTRARTHACLVSARQQGEACRTAPSAGCVWAATWTLRCYNASCCYGTCLHLHARTPRSTWLTWRAASARTSPAWRVSVAGAAGVVAMSAWA